MNLYDKDDGFRAFRLQEANALLPEIIAATERAVAAIDRIQSHLKGEESKAPWSEPGSIDQETSGVLQQWSEQMVRFGVYPKGYFTVDFKSFVPDTLLCWTYGEHEIGHTHKVYENFKDRVPINDKHLLGFEDSIN
ncbi:MAG TPA: DUF2203 family protein [bacterium]